jgi:enamine deaminase RidA (YjgF/YER057c/UK114 family)
MSGSSCRTIACCAAAGGCSPNDLVHVQVLLGDIDDYSAIND